jgi:DNA-binding MarR family transcriptional regulator
MENSKNETFALFTSTMVKAQNELKAFMRNKLKGHNIDLTFEMLQVLIHLWEKQGVNQQELANLLHKDKASMTYLIDNLSKRKLLRRSEDSADRRNKLITLTPAGLALKSLILPWIDELYTVAGKNVTKETLQNGISLFETMYSNLAATGK